MRQLPPALRQHLDSGATSLCYCWKLTRADDQVQGFTDHDRNLTIENVTYEASSGFDASALESGLGLKPGNLEASGALSSTSISENDIAAGKYDDAKVELWRVNWRDITQRLLLMKGTLGEIRRSETRWIAELRSLASKLDTPSGRLFQYACDADLGDKRCGVDIRNLKYSATGLIAEQKDDAYRVSALDSYDTPLFAHGRGQFLSGALEGQHFNIRTHYKRNNQIWIEVWEALSPAPAVGDRIQLTAGCDKQFSTCCKIFANGQNFRGCPHMPGDDFVIAPASER